MLLSHHSHATAAPARTQPFKGRQLTAHAAEQAQKRVGRAQAARALGDNNCAHCSVRASSPTARRHRRIAPLARPDHQASLRCGRRGRAALLPTRRVPPRTAESLQLRCCFSALGATPLMRLRTRNRQQGVNERARRRKRRRNGWGELRQLARSATIIALTAACAQAAPRPAATAGSHRWLCQTIRRRCAAGGEVERRFCRPGECRRGRQNHSSCAAASRRSEPRR